MITKDTRQRAYPNREYNKADDNTLLYKQTRILSEAYRKSNLNTAGKLKPMETKQNITVRVHKTKHNHNYFILFYFK